MQIIKVMLKDAPQHHHRIFVYKVQDFCSILGANFPKYNLNYLWTVLQIGF